MGPALGAAALTDCNMAPAASLTGVWIGRYFYPRTLQPVEFVAAIIESGSCVTGTTSEISAGKIIRLNATILGDHTGGSVSFVKTYDNPDQLHDLPVHYSGKLNADATQISGTWTITGHLSGAFVMMRELRKAQAQARKRKASAPV